MGRNRKLPVTEAAEQGESPEKLGSDSTFGFFVVVDRSCDDFLMQRMAA